MELVSNAIISGEAIRLDDKHFVDCTFKGCQLIYGGGGVILERTSFLRCSHFFEGPARATVLYLKTIGLIGTEANEWTERSESVH